MTLLEKFIERAKDSGKKVVFPEGTDERILHAAVTVRNEKIAEPVLVGAGPEIASAAEKYGIDINGLQIVDPVSSPLFPDLVALYVSRRKNVSPRVAERLVRRDMIFGGMLVASGNADCMVAGAANTTASVIQASALTVGYREGLSTPSSFFIMVLPDSKVIFYADCGVNIDPDAGQLAEIGIATAESYRKLMGDEPRVAFLSFSSKGSASHPLVEKVSNAVRLAREKSPEILFDGEFQADTALVEAVAKKKLKEPGDVAGRANVLIFPDLNAGNIAYKLTQYLAGAGAYGPILQGFAKPVSDLSRGAKAGDIVGVTAIVSLQT